MFITRSKSVRLLDWQDAGLRTIENLVHVRSDAAKQIRNVRSVGYRGAGIHVLSFLSLFRVCRQVYPLPFGIDQIDT